MPANLNALIRYKQIDKCLRNRFADCTIQRMQEVCSEALAEFRGVYKLVSERTIRDDIRVMRSEMLGFNAPIVFEDGKYYYDDPSYSIFDVSIEEKELLKEVLQMLLKERDKLGSGEVDSLLKRIAAVTGEVIPQVEIEDTDTLIQEKKISPIQDAGSRINYNKMPKRLYSLSPDAEEKESPLDRAMRELALIRSRQDNALYWGYILEIL